MSSVKRYGQFYDEMLGSWWGETPNGAWVKYSDYAALELECEELRHKHSEAVSAKADALTTASAMQARAEAAEARVKELEAREDLLERTIDDKWRTRKYIVCRDYQLADMMAMTWRVMDWHDADRAKLSRAMEWMRGRCACCGNLDHYYRLTTGPCTDCRTDASKPNWTPPKELEG